MPLIECRDLSLAYEGRVVESGVSFPVARGDYLCIVGENGSGKSTLVKALLGLLKPAGGSIVYGDGLRRIAMAVCAGTNQVACALAPGGQGLSYALAAPDGTDARALGRALNEAFAGRGGGKPAFCQGSLAQPGLTPDVVREKLSTLL